MESLPHSICFEGSLFRCPLVKQHNKNREDKNLGKKSRIASSTLSKVSDLREREDDKE